jgi:uncharacterized protein (TIGR02271 family)
MALRGQDVYDNDGDKIGSLEQVYVDNDTGEPEWVAVKTGFFGTKLSLIPLQGAQHDGRSLRVMHSKGVVKDAPNVDPDGELNEEEVARLYRHYGLDYGTTSTRERDLTTGEGTIARDTSGPETDTAMTRSEEQLHVGKTRNEAAGGRVRLRKYVVTDQETVSVPVEREVARIEREPITGANRDAAYSGPDLSDEEAEITLSEEQVQVDKTTVPKERVRLEKDVVTEEQKVTEDLSREEIEVDSDVENPRRRR